MLENIKCFMTTLTILIVILLWNNSLFKNRCTGSPIFVVKLSRDREMWFLHFFDETKGPKLKICTASYFGNG